MPTHQDRLLLLADAMRIPPDKVVAALRGRDVLYFGPSGSLLFACGDEWPDERLVEAAVQLFIVEEPASEPSPAATTAPIYR